MSWRSVNRLGWGGGGGSSQTPVEILNEAVPYMSIDMDPSVFSAGLTQPAIYHQDFEMAPTPTGDDTQNAWEFNGGTGSTEIYTRWQFRNFPIDYADPQFKFFAQFIQIDDAVAPNPPEYAFMQLGIGVSYEGTTTDYTLETGSEPNAQCLIPDERISFAFGTSGDLALDYNLALKGDGALSLANFNYLRFEVERAPDNVLDTYANSIYFLGGKLQFKTDFNNLSAYPT